MAHTRPVQTVDLDVFAVGDVGLIRLKGVDGVGEKEGDDPKHYPIRSETNGTFSAGPKTKLSLSLSIIQFEW